MAKLERIYTIPLGDAYEAVRNKRVPRAVKILRTFVARHMKADGERIVLSTALNEHLWQRSIQKPPRKVKVRLVKEADSIRAYLADEKEEKKAPAKAEPKKEAKPEAKKEEKPAQKAETKPAHKEPPKHEAKGEHKPHEKHEAKNHEPTASSKGASDVSKK